jgi:hypothetical protein
VLLPPRRPAGSLLRRIRTRGGAALSIHLCVAAGGCGVSASVARPEAPEAHPAVAECRLVERSRQELITHDGLSLYIQPAALVRSGDEVLIAGSFTFGHRWIDGRARQVAMDSLFVAVIAADGRATPVFSPVGARPTRSPRAVPRPEGGWDVVFTEIRSDSEASDGPARVAKLWHGVYRAGRWESVSEIPLPPGGELAATSASHLLRAGDTLLWAIAGVPGRHRHVAVLRGIRGRWHGDTVGVGGASYMALGHHPRHGAALAVVRLGERGEVKAPMSLYLHALDRTAGGPVLIDSGTTNAHLPNLIATREGFLVVWKSEDGVTRTQVRAADVVPGGGPAAWREVEPSSGPARAVHLVAVGGEPWWLFEHRSDSVAVIENRVLAGSAMGSRELARFETPFFAGIVGVAAGKGSELVLAGPTTRDGITVSHLIRMERVCTRGRAVHASSP